MYLLYDSTHLEKQVILQYNISISQYQISFLLRRWPVVVMRSAYQADAGKKEDGPQHAVNHQAFDLPLGAAGIHKNNSKIDEPGNTEQGKNDTKYTFDVHITSLPGILQKACHTQTVGNRWLNGWCHIQTFPAASWLTFATGNKLRHQD